MGVIQSTSGRLAPLRETSNACGHGAFARISVCDRQYFPAGHVVTPLVGLSINATSPVLSFFSEEMTCKGEQTMLA
jgi:hypothetical protein